MDYAEIESSYVELLSKAVACKPITGDEGRVAELFVEALNEIGVKGFIDACGNAIGIINGVKPGPTIVLTGHMDVVPAGNIEAWGEFDPFEARVIDGKLYGRGVSDMLGGLCAQFFAFREVKKAVENGLELCGNLIFAGVVQEESAESFGALYLIRHTFPEHDLKPDVVFLGEPTCGDLCIGHRGKVELVVDVYGKVAHSSAPEDGISALEKAIPVMEAINNNFYLPVEQHESGHTSMAITDVELTPGRTFSCIPDKCEITIDRRYVPPVTEQDTISQIKNFLEGMKERDPEFRGDVHPRINHKRSYTGYEEDLVKRHPYWSTDKANNFLQLSKKELESLGYHPEIRYWTFGTDGSAFSGQYNIPTLGYSGAVDSLAHQPKENVDISEMIKSIKGYISILFGIFK